MNAKNITADAGERSDRASPIGTVSGHRACRSHHTQLIELEELALTARNLIAWTELSRTSGGPGSQSAQLPQVYKTGTTWNQIERFHIPDQRVASPFRGDGVMGERWPFLAAERESLPKNRSRIEPLNLNIPCRIRTPEMRRNVPARHPLLSTKRGTRVRSENGPVLETSLGFFDWTGRHEGRKNNLSPDSQKRPAGPLQPFSTQFTPIQHPKKKNFSKPHKSDQNQRRPCPPLSDVAHASDARQISSATSPGEEGWDEGGNFLRPTATILSVRRNLSCAPGYHP
jgi:hypothetical protein